jgi:hypothetical protein
MGILLEALNHRTKSNSFRNSGLESSSKLTATDAIFRLASHVLPSHDFWEAIGRRYLHNYLISLARSEGFEPPALRFEV